MLKTLRAKKRYSPALLARKISSKKVNVYLDRKCIGFVHPLKKGGWGFRIGEPYPGRGPEKCIKSTVKRDNQRDAAYALELHYLGENVT